MALKNQLLKNNFWSLLANVTQNLVLSTLFIVLARFLGPFLFSKYTIGNSLYQMVGGLSTMGLSHYFLREYSIMQDNDNKEKTLNEFVSAEFILSILGYTILLLSAMFIYYNDTLILKIALLIGINILFDNLLHCIHTIFRATNLQFNAFKVNLSEAFFRLSFSSLLLYLNVNLFIIILVLVLLRFQSLIYARNLLIKENINISFYDMWNNLFEKTFYLNSISYLKKCITFAVIGSVSTLYWRVNTIILSKLSDLIHVSYFELGYKLFSVLQVIPVILLTNYYPLMCKQRTVSVSSYNALILTIFRQVSMFSFLVYSFFYFTLPFGIKLLFGEEYLPALSVSRLMLIMIIPFSSSLVQAYILLSSGLEKVDMYLNIIVLLISVISALILIPIFNEIGAAVGIIVAFVVFHFIQFIIISRRTDLMLKKMKVQYYFLCLSCLVSTYLIQNYVNTSNFIIQTFLTLAMISIPLTLFGWNKKSMVVIKH